MKSADSERVRLIRFYGDSVGMPRVDEGIAYESTFPYLTKKSLDSTRTDVLVRSEGGATVSAVRMQVEKDLSYFGERSTDVIVIHSGIVDCAPRLLSPRLRHLVSLLPPRLRRYVIGVLHVLRPVALRHGISSSLTGPRSFREEMVALIELAQQSAGCVLVMLIADPNERLESDSPGIKDRVAEYNRIIVEAVNRFSGDVQLISATDESADEIVGGDGHHFSLRGHEVIARRIVQRIKETEASGAVGDVQERRAETGH